MTFCATLSLQYHFDVGKRYHVTMSFQCKYVVGLHRDENPIENRCRHNTACPLGKLFLAKIMLII